MKALDNQQEQTSSQFKFQHESFDEDEKEGFDDVEEDSFNFTRFIRNLPDLWYEIYCRILHYFFYYLPESRNPVFFSHCALVVLNSALRLAPIPKPGMMITQSSQ